MKEKYDNKNTIIYLGKGRVDLEANFILSTSAENFL
jgi:hypothetical protein